MAEAMMIAVAPSRRQPMADISGQDYMIIIVHVMPICEVGARHSSEKAQ